MASASKESDIQDMLSLLHDDIATEILSRLPANSLLAFRCTSKSWDTFISDPSFLRIYGQTPKPLLGLFVQQMLQRDMLLTYIPLDKEPRKVEDPVLNFLPEQVILIASSSGILCCQSFIDKSFQNVEDEINAYSHATIYICNPATRQWITLSPPRGTVVEAFGFTFFPYGSSSSASGPSFKLVGIHHSENDPNSCSFIIYSSETEAWEISREVCNLASKVVAYTHKLLNGRCHWLTRNHHLLTFDIDQELSQVIKLPGVELDQRFVRVGRLGDSQGCLHYMCAYQFELMIWTLKEYNEPEWVLRFCLPLIVFYKEHLEMHPRVRKYFKFRDPPNWANPYFRPLTFYNESLFVMENDSLFSYNFESRKVVMHCGLEEMGLRYYLPHIVLPYCPTVTSLSHFKDARVKEPNQTGGNSYAMTKKEWKSIMV